MRRRRKFTILLITTLISVLLFTNIAFARQKHRSIKGDFFNKVFDIQLTNGSLAFDTPKIRSKREQINNEILEGTNKNYSLYDRFGGDIRFVPYFGEVQIKTNIFDRFYAKYLENDMRFGISASDLKLFLQQPAISNNVIYEGRANVLPSEYINSGFKDSRVAAYSPISNRGGNASLGNTLLTISKSMLSFISFFTDNSVYDLINSIVVKSMNSWMGDLIEALSNMFLPLCIAVALFGIVRMSIKLVKGEYAIKSFITNVLGGLISLGIIYSFVASPLAFNDMLLNVVNSIDNVFDASFQMNASDVVKSSINDNVREATIWEVAVFKPWCYGMFGDEYENLYTQYATLKSGQKAMEQDNDDVVTSWNDGSIKYNSAAITGDVVVPVGKKEIRNWAALAWSCQSIYHIDAVKTDEERTLPNVWPKALTTPLNKQIYVDNFRWLDAKLNISPEYVSPDKVRMNYSNSRNYTEHFVSAGFKSLYFTLLLLPILILGIRRTVASVKMAFTGVSLIFNSLLNFIMPGEYNILANLKRIVRPVYDYLWWSIVIFIGITLYKNIVGDNHLANLLWIISGIYLNALKPIYTTARLNAMVNKAKRTTNKIGRKIKNTFDKKAN